MTKEVGKMEGERCDCECHKHGESGMCKMMGLCPVGMSSMSHSGPCSHSCVAGHVWKIMLIFIGVLAVFWIGMACGEFRSAWDMNRGVDYISGLKPYQDPYGNGRMHILQGSQTVTVDSEAVTSEKAK